MVSRNLGLGAMGLPIAFALIAGCATVLSGTSQAISIDSNVPGADVRINGNLIGRTPYAGKIKRQKNPVATVSHDGYMDQPVILTTSYNSVALISIFWDLSTTDFLTGAAWKYTPESYFVNLKKEGQSDVSFRNESSLKAFAMTYFGDIQIELLAGGGPLLTAMAEHYFPDCSVERFVQIIQGLDKADAVHFGQAVGDLLAA